MLFNNYFEQSQKPLEDMHEFRESSNYSQGFVIPENRYYDDEEQQGDCGFQIDTMGMLEQVQRQPGEFCRLQSPFDVTEENMVQESYLSYTSTRRVSEAPMQGGSAQSFSIVESGWAGDAIDQQDFNDEDYLENPPANMEVNDFNAASIQQNAEIEQDDAEIQQNIDKSDRLPYFQVPDKNAHPKLVKKILSTVAPSRLTPKLRQILRKLCGYMADDDSPFWKEISNHLTQHEVHTLKQDAGAERSQYRYRAKKIRDQKQTIVGHEYLRRDNIKAQTSIVTCLLDQYNLEKLHRFMADRRCNFAFFLIYQKGVLTDYFKEDKQALQALASLVHICTSYACQYRMDSK